MALHAVQLKVNFRSQPLGIDTPNPEFSWSLASDHSSVLQTAYQVQISHDESFDSLMIVWHSGVVSSDLPFGSRYDGESLKSRTRYFWRVVVWDQDQQQGSWSETSWFETGFYEISEFNAQWITRKLLPKRVQREDKDTLYFRCLVDIPEAVTAARMYATALGWYKSFVNGTNITGGAQVPRWTPYDHYTEYQVYDVTNLLHEGMNILGAIVSDGHFRGENGGLSARNCYGDRIAFYALVEIELASGKVISFSTDEKWVVSTGRILESDPKTGEQVDLRISEDQWLHIAPDTEHHSFEVVDILSTATAALIGEETERVDEIRRLKPARVWMSPSGKHLVDFGQNFAGVIRILLKGERGCKISLTYSEVLTRGGELDIDYLEPVGKGKPQRDEVILSGSQEWFEPMFTIHGFRYVEIAGLSLSDEFHTSDVEAIVMSSQLIQKGEFSCSDKRLEQLYHNTLWSLLSNFMATPTDCPTRERSGWTGDIQVFSTTSMLMADTHGYLRRYLRNLKAEQWHDGRIPPFIPSGDSKFSGVSLLSRLAASSVGWGDASVLIPWRLYQHYGDISILEEQYESMKKWVEFMEVSARTKKSWFRWLFGGPAQVEQYVLDSGLHWGEWLRPGETGVFDFIKGIFLFPSAAVPTAYFAESSHVLSKVARILDHEDDASYYLDLSAKVKDAWSKSFIREGGRRVAEDKQDDYIRMVRFDLGSKDEQKKALARLAELVRNADYHLGTGFLSTRELMPTLCENGYSEEAFRILLQTTPPSWIYPIEKGATTIWETWEGYNKTGDAYLSHNHYSLGAIAGWLVNGLVGLTAASPGWRRIRIAPEIGHGITHAGATIEIPFGKLSSSWKLNEETGDVRIELDVPAGTTADVYLGNKLAYTVGSGTHQFHWRKDEL